MKTICATFNAICNSILPLVLCEVRKYGRTDPFQTQRMAGKHLKLPQHCTSKGSSPTEPPKSDLMIDPSMEGGVGGSLNCLGGEESDGTCLGGEGPPMVLSYQRN